MVIHAAQTMLRITVTETAVEERWILQGQLTQRSIAELGGPVGEPPWPNHLRDNLAIAK